MFIDIQDHSFNFFTPVIINISYHSHLLLGHTVCESPSDSSVPCPDFYDGRLSFFFSPMKQFDHPTKNVMDQNGQQVLRCQFGWKGLFIFNVCHELESQLLNCGSVGGLEFDFNSVMSTGHDFKNPTIAIKISPFPKLPILETYEFIYINYICFRDLRGYNYTHMMGSNLWYLWLQLYPSTSPIAIWGPRWLPSRCQVMPAIPVWPPRMDEKTSDWRIRN